MKRLTVAAGFLIVVALSLFSESAISKISIPNDETCLTIPVIYSTTLFFKTAIMLVVPSEVDEHIQKNYPYIQSIRSKVSYQYRNKDDIEIAKPNGYRDGKNLVAQR